MLPELESHTGPQVVPNWNAFTLVCATPPGTTQNDHTVRLKAALDLPLIIFQRFLYGAIWFSAAVPLH